MRDHPYCDYGYPCTVHLPLKSDCPHLAFNGATEELHEATDNAVNRMGHLDIQL